MESPINARIVITGDPDVGFYETIGRKYTECKVEDEISECHAQLTLKR